MGAAIRAKQALELEKAVGRERQAALEARQAEEAARARARAEELEGKVMVLRLQLAALPLRFLSDGDLNTEPSPPPPELEWTGVGAAQAVEERLREELWGAQVRSRHQFKGLVTTSMLEPVHTFIVQPSRPPPARHAATEIVPGHPGAQAAIAEVQAELDEVSAAALTSFEVAAAARGAAAEVEEQLLGETWHG